MIIPIRKTRAWYSQSNQSDGLHSGAIPTAFGFVAFWIYSATGWAGASTEFAIVLSGDFYEARLPRAYDGPWLTRLAREFAHEAYLKDCKSHHT